MYQHLDTRVESRSITYADRRMRASATGAFARARLLNVKPRDHSLPPLGGGPRPPPGGRSSVVLMAMMKSSNVGVHRSCAFRRAFINAGNLRTKRCGCDTRGPQISHCHHEPDEDVRRENILDAFWDRGSSASRRKESGIVEDRHIPGSKELMARK
jgi:hypothetical protein